MSGRRQRNKRNSAVGRLGRGERCEILPGGRDFPELARHPWSCRCAGKRRPTDVIGCGNSGAFSRFQGKERGHLNRQESKLPGQHRYVPSSRFIRSQCATLPGSSFDTGFEIGYSPQPPLLRSSFSATSKFHFWRRLSFSAPSSSTQFISQIA